jgi:hypothetical protein
MILSSAPLVLIMRLEGKCHAAVMLLSAVLPGGEIWSLNK